MPAKGRVYFIDPVTVGGQTSALSDKVTLSGIAYTVSENISETGDREHFPVAFVVEEPFFRVIPMELPRVRKCSAYAAKSLTAAPAS